jgi:predicted ATP-binding protein involved in virulence
MNESSRDVAVVLGTLEQAISLLQCSLSSDLTNLEVIIRQERDLVPVYEEESAVPVGLLQKGPQRLVIEVADFKNAGEITSTKKV